MARLNIRQQINLLLEEYEVNITQEQADEFLKCKNDIVYFAENYVQHISPYGDIKQLKLYPYQIQVLEDDIVTAETSRQIGFSLCSHIKILHSIIFNREKTIVFYTPSRDRASYSMQSIATLLDFCTLPETFKPKFITRNKTELRFDNDVRVVSASNTGHIRGGIISELYMEEVDYYKESIEEILVAWSLCVSKFTSSSPKIWAWSCPSNGNIGKVGRALEHYKNHNHYNLAWYVIPNRDSKWKREVIKNIDKDRFENQFNNKDNSE